MKSSNWVIVLVVILGLGLLVWGSIASRNPSSSGTVNEEQEAILSLKSDDWVKGATSSEVVLVEYSDFQCPACRQYHEPVKVLVDEFGDRLTFAYRHFPLRRIHFNAQIAAQAAEAAGMQGKFFEMHDLLFERQPEWSGNSSETMLETLNEYAVELELDLLQFNEDLESDEVKGYINEDLENALLLGVNATPTFFLNGEKMNNPNSIDEFRLLIQQALGDITITTEPLQEGVVESVELR